MKKKKPVRKPLAPPEGLRETIHFYLIDNNTALGKALNILIILLNVLIVAIFILRTYVGEGESDLSPEFGSFLTKVELVIVGFFIIEYIARLYGAKKRIRHIFTPFALIDFFAIIPTIVEIFVGAADIGILKLLRMFRVFRVLRFLRFFQTNEFFFGKISEELLRVLRLSMTIFMIFFVASGLFFFVENTENPSVNNFGDAFYFMVVALTTVGFGDIVPATSAGRFVTVFCILSGIILIPWQASEVIRGWIHLSHQKEIQCAHCGLCWHDTDAVHCKSCGNLLFHDHEDT